MFHKSHMDSFNHQFPHDTQGFVPHPGDHWRDMNFEQEGLDPDEEGISVEEHDRRVAYLNSTWWPEVLKCVEEEKQRLETEHGETFIQHWKHVLEVPTSHPHGFGVGNQDTGIDD